MTTIADVDKALAGLADKEQTAREVLEKERVGFAAALLGRGKPDASKMADARATLEALPMARAQLLEQRAALVAAQQQDALEREQAECEALLAEGVRLVDELVALVDAAGPKLARYQDIERFLRTREPEVFGRKQRAPLLKAADVLQALAGVVEVRRRRQYQASRRPWAPADA